MRRSLGSIIYGVVLFLLPVFEIVITAPATARPWIIFFPLIATASFFTLPRRTWSVLTLLGAVWCDVALLSPYGPTLLGAVVLAMSLTLLTARLAGRSLWSDYFVILAAVLLSTGTSGVVFALVGYFGWHMFTTPDFYNELLALLLIGFFEAIWLHRRGVNNLYIQ